MRASCRFREDQRVWIKADPEQGLPREAATVLPLDELDWDGTLCVQVDDMHLTSDWFDDGVREVTEEQLEEFQPLDYFLCQLDNREGVANCIDCDEHTYVVGYVGSGEWYGHSESGLTIGPLATPELCLGMLLPFAGVDAI